MRVLPNSGDYAAHQFPTNPATRPAPVIETNYLLIRVHCCLPTEPLLGGSQFGHCPLVATSGPSECCRMRMSVVPASRLRTGCYNNAFIEACSRFKSWARNHRDLILPPVAVWLRLDQPPVRIGGGALLSPLIRWSSVIRAAWTASRPCRRASSSGAICRVSGSFRAASARRWAHHTRDSARACRWRCARAAGAAER